MNNCRLCKSTEIVNLGSIPFCDEFAGKSTDIDIDAGNLYQCNFCFSLLRFPILSQKKYLNLYKFSDNPVAWSGVDSNRQDLQAIKQYIDSIDRGLKVLEIGCFDGAFLASLSKIHEIYGIEPSVAAASVAQRRGVKVLGGDLSDLRDKELEFDLILVVDVVEHLVDVEQFLSQSIARLTQNGSLILSTGNPESIFWSSIFKSKFWYCSFPEHITFPSLKYFQIFCKRELLPEPTVIFFRYRKLKIIKLILLLIAQVLFFISPKIYRIVDASMRKILCFNKRESNNFGLMAAGVFRDHQLIAIKNKKCHPAT